MLDIKPQIQEALQKPRRSTVKENLHQGISYTNFRISRKSKNNKKKTKKTKLKEAGVAGVGVVEKRGSTFPIRERPELYSNSQKRCKQEENGMKYFKCKRKQKYRILCSEELPFKSIRETLSQTKKKNWENILPTDLPCKKC